MISVCGRVSWAHLFRAGTCLLTLTCTSSNNSFSLPFICHDLQLGPINYPILSAEWKLYCKIRCLHHIASRMHVSIGPKCSPCHSWIFDVFISCWEIILFVLHLKLLFDSRVSCAFQRNQVGLMEYLVICGIFCALFCWYTLADFLSFPRYISCVSWTLNYSLSLYISCGFSFTCLPRSIILSIIKISVFYYCSGILTVCHQYCCSCCVFIYFYASIVGLLWHAIIISIVITSCLFFEWCTCLLYC